MGGLEGPVCRGTLRAVGTGAGAAGSSQRAGLGTVVTCRQSSEALPKPPLWVLTPRLGAQGAAAVPSWWGGPHQVEWMALEEPSSEVPAAGVLCLTWSAGVGGLVSSPGSAADPRHGP